MANRRDNLGVTLVEMLVVVGILTLLAGFIVSLTLRFDTQSKERDLTGIFLLLKSALMEYQEEMGGFPEQPEKDFGTVDDEYDKAHDHAELMYEKLNSIPASRQVLKRVNGVFVRGDLSDDDPLKIYDGWGSVLDYRYDPNDGNFPELISAGPDKEFETTDDISSKDI